MKQQFWYQNGCVWVRFGFGSWVWPTKFLGFDYSWISLRLVQWLTLDPFLMLLLCLGANLRHFRCVWIHGRDPQVLWPWLLVWMRSSRDPMVSAMVLVAASCYYSWYVIVLVTLLWFIMVFDINGCRYYFLAKTLILKLVVIYWLTLIWLGIDL